MANEGDPLNQAAADEPIASEQYRADGSPMADRNTSLGQDQDGSQAIAQAGRTALRKVLIAGLASVLVVTVGVGLFLVLKGHNHLRASNGNSLSEFDRPSAAVIPVNTIRPRRKTLVRTLEQPGTIRPWAQAELYAKASGYLQTIRRVPTAALAVDLAVQPMLGLGPAVAAARMATAAYLQLRAAPQIDIGSPVTAGEILLEIASPERHQEIIEKETLVQQREAELAAARIALATFEGAIQVARAQKTQAEAEVRRYAAEYSFRSKEWNRLKELVQSKTIIQEIADEKESQVGAALAAWESSQAKVQTAQAEFTVVSSKLTTAQADIKVKETLVQVAKDALRLAVVLADYSRIHAPFDGVITYRGVDEGDFVQNATSGQSGRLMTVTALDKVKVVLQVPEHDAPWVQVGTEAALIVDARTGGQVRGRVTRIANALDPQTRTMQAEIDLENRDRRLLPGMYGKLMLILQRIPNAQAIPATAVYSRKGENFVIQAENGIAHRQKVRIRFDDGKEMEVIKLMGAKEVALDGSEELIVSNKGEIAEGQRVKSTLLGNGAARSPGGAAKDKKYDHQDQSLAPPPAPDGRHVLPLGGFGRVSSSFVVGAAADRRTGSAADRVPADAAS